MSEEGADERCALRLVDAHCHLDDFGEGGDAPAGQSALSGAGATHSGPHEFGDRGSVLRRARQAGLVHLVVNGLWRAPGDFGCALELARVLPDFVSATAAVHPHDAARPSEEDFERLAALARDPAIRAVGETGLDYHYDLSPRGVQREVMRRHIRLAREVHKPLVFHIREAHADALSIFREEGAAGHPTQIHCFTGTCDEARAWLDLGCHLSFSGALTFKKSDEIRAAARLVPLDRLLVETDSPFLAPAPHRGERCEPAFVALTLRCRAGVRGVPPAELAALTSQNAARVFAFSL